MCLAENLKKLISKDEKVKSPSDLAKKIGISRQTMSLIVKGDIYHPKTDTLDKLCDYLSCSRKELLGFDPLDIQIKLEHLMIKNKVSQSTLSAGSGISKSTISKILNGKHYALSKKTIFSICDFFNITPNYFKK